MFVSEILDIVCTLSAKQLEQLFILLQCRLELNFDVA